MTARASSHAPPTEVARGFRGVTTSTNVTINPGLDAVRARLAELGELAVRIKRDSLSDRESMRLRIGLRHVAGVRVFAPEQPTLDALEELGLVELVNPSLAPVCGRYRPTDLGVEVLGLLGRGGR